MAIELAITDETPQHLLVDTDDFLRAFTPPVLSDQEVLDCFLEAKLDGSYRQYLLAAGRAIEAKAHAVPRPVVEQIGEFTISRAKQPGRVFIHRPNGEGGAFDHAALACAVHEAVAKFYAENF